jgi:hypothetical protein
LIALSIKKFASGDSWIPPVSTALPDSIKDPVSNLRACTNCNKYTSNSYEPRTAKKINNPKKKLEKGGRVTHQIIRLLQLKDREPAHGGMIERRTQKLKSILHVNVHPSHQQLDGLLDFDGVLPHDAFEEFRERLVTFELFVRTVKENEEGEEKEKMR